MHIAIFGAGSVGSYVGGMMTRAGRDVTLVDPWPDHIETMRRDGLTLSGTQGKFNMKVNCLHLHETDKLLRKPVDVAIICVKSYQTAWITTMLREYLSPNGVVVSMQNSMNEEAIAGIVGWGRTIGCIISTIGVEMVAPGKVVRSFAPAAPGYIVFRVGEVHCRPTQRAAAIAEALSAVDNAGITTNLWGERWSKLTNNAMASGIHPVSGLRTAEMFDRPDARRLSIKVAHECVKVGKALGLQLDHICGIDPELWLAAAPGARDVLAKIEEQLVKWRGRIGPKSQASTAHDIRRGRRTEIDYINGLVARKGEETGVPAPINAELTALVKKLERGEIKQGMENIEHLLAACRQA